MRKPFAPLLPLVTSAGCVCGGSVAVPDHRPPPSPASTTVPAELAPLGAAEHPDGTRELSLEGSGVRLEGGSIRASGVFDFDRDGDRDAVLVVLDAGTARVLFAARDSSDAFGPWTELASRATDAAPEGGCMMSRAEVVALSTQLVVARAEATCAAPPSRRLLAWVLSSDERPRSLEVLELMAGEGEALSFQASDRDGDGHDDLEAEVTLVSGGGTVSVSLGWVSRAAGLAREGAEPDTSIASLSARARERLRRAPETAASIAAQAIELREALCRDSESPRLRVGGAPGLPCRDAAAAGRALAVRAAARVRTLGAGPLTDLASLDAALDATLALDRAGLTVRAPERTLVHDAWARVATALPRGVIVSGGGEVAPVSDRASPRLSTLGFLDEERLLVRGPSPRILRLDGHVTATEEAPVGSGDARLIDADGRLELVSIERRCAGTTLVLAPAGGVVDAVTGVRREVLAAPRPAPAPCPPIDEALRVDDGGMVALGWAPQGIVLAHGSRLVIVPLDVSGAPAGAPSEIGVDVPPPVPLAVGAAVADARAHALALPFGILVFDREARSATLYRDTGFEPPDGLPVDVALSPSRARAAWLCGGTVCWADLRGTDTADAGTGG